MRSSYNKILHGLHSGQSSKKSQLKMSSTRSKRCPASSAEWIFLAPGHWTSRWQNENTGEIHILCSLNIIKGASWLPPLKHLAFYLLCFSLAFSLVGKVVEWSPCRLMRWRVHSWGTHIRTYYWYIPPTVLYPFPLLEILMTTIITIPIHWYPLCATVALCPLCHSVLTTLKDLGQSYYLFFYR